MLSSANRVGEFAEGVQVGGVIESDAFVKRQPLAIFNLNAISRKFESNENCIFLMQILPK